MAGNKSKKRLEALTPQNRLWAEEFLATMPEKSGKQYISKMCGYMEIRPLENLNEITFEEAERYFLNLYENGTNTESPVEYVKSFLQYVAPSTSLKYDPKLLTTLIKKKDKKRNSYPLKINDINKIREITLPFPELFFSFEMAYTYGLKLKQLSNCSRANYKDGHLHIDGVSIEFHGMLKQMIEDNHALLQPRSINTHQDRYKKIGELMQDIGYLSDRRTITWQDINRTREEYFIKCQLCDERYENTSSNWVLFQYDNDPTESKWIVCRIHAKEVVAIDQHQNL